MMDLRHPEDQLFLVFEADFRFYECDCVGAFDWVEELAKLEQETGRAANPDAEHPAWLGRPGLYAESVARGSGTQDADAEPAARGEWTGEAHAEPVACGAQQVSAAMPSYGGFMPGTRSRAREAYVSEELNDLVRVCTHASRVGLGDIVWLSWEGSSKGRKLSPSHGSTLLGLTRCGASSLETLMSLTKKVYHFDVWLRDHLIKDAAKDVPTLKASYCCPSIGSYDEHLSGCDPTNAGPGGVRASSWNESWVQEGVRPDPSNSQHKERWICKFANKGGPLYQIRVDFFPRRALCWLTRAPPRNWWADDYAWRHVLQARGWIKHERFCLPGYAEAASRGASRPPRGGKYWKLLADSPNDFDWEEQVERWSPISRIAEQIVVDYPQYNPLDWPSKRQRHSRSKHLQHYKRRIFIDDEREEVFWHARVFHSQRASLPHFKSEGASFILESFGRCLRSHSPAWLGKDLEEDAQMPSLPPYSSKQISKGFFQWAPPQVSCRWIFQVLAEPLARVFGERPSQKTSLPHFKSDGASFILEYFGRCLRSHSLAWLGKDLEEHAQMPSLPPYRSKQIFKGFSQWAPPEFSCRWPLQVLAEPLARTFKGKDLEVHSQKASLPHFKSEGASFILEYFARSLRKRP